MSDTRTEVFVPFIKKERNDDGTYTVFGKAAGPDLDLDQQVMNEAWLETAMPTWFRTGANVREGHSLNAVGKGAELTKDGEDWWLKSTIVDPVTCTKLDHDVLTGYSVGIKNGRILTKSARAPKGEIVGGDVIEVSVVDRPANPTCRLMLLKSADSGSLEACDAEFVVWDEVTKSYVPEVADDVKRAEFIRKAIEAHAVIVKSEEAAPLKAALDAICELIQAEAAELSGDLSEVYDIEALLCALRSLREFWWSEAAAGEVPAPDSETGTEVLTASEEGTMEFSTIADLVKAAQADDATDEVKSQFEDVRRAIVGDEFITKAALTDTVKSAVTEVVTTVTEDLVKRLETVEKAAAPSGPVKSRTAADVATATAREDHITKAAHFDHLATSVTDRDAAKGYRELADEHRSAAERLAPAVA